MLTERAVEITALMSYLDTMLTECSYCPYVLTSQTLLESASHFGYGCEQIFVSSETSHTVRCEKIHVVE